MRLVLSEEQVVELRRAVINRIENLGKLEKKLKGEGLSTRPVTQALEILVGDDGTGGLKYMLAEQLDHEQERRWNGQEDLPFEGSPSQSIDEALEGVEEEGAERARVREIRAALVEALPPAPGVPLTNLDLEQMLTDHWRGWVSEDEEARYVATPGTPARPGFFRHVTLDRSAVWCWVGNDAGLVLFYDVDPRTDSDDWTVFVEGDALLALARELLQVEPAPVAALRSGEPEEMIEVDYEIVDEVEEDEDADADELAGV